MKRALSAAAIALCFSAQAFAQTPPGKAAEGRLDPDAPPSTIHIVNDSEPQTPVVPRAGDVLGSHVLLGAAVGPAWALGPLGSRTSSRSGLGTGIGFRADAGVGLSRTVSVGLWGGYTGYAEGNACADCKGRSFSIGPFVRYQLTQGLRFDPWMTLGSSYRQVSFTDSANAKNTFKGVEWLRFELGADYYVLSGFGFGPYGALSLSSYATRPESAGSSSVGTELSFGLRFLLDLPGR